MWDPQETREETDGTDQIGQKAERSGRKHRIGNREQSNGSGQRKGVIVALGKAKGLICGIPAVKVVQDHMCTLHGP